MKLCNKDHEEVCFSSYECPVCWTIKHLKCEFKKLISDLKVEILDKIKEEENA